MDHTGPLARRFPLVARRRPPCIPLGDRVGELSALADTAARQNDRTAASAVHNQAALLASDAGLAELARQWCHRHAAAYLRAAPLDAQAARHGLEPLVNLARLRIRDGEGARALQLLRSLYRAVSTASDTVLDGVLIPGSKLILTDAERREVRTWLWSVLLADGTRALTSSGRWDEALAYLRRHQGIGGRMLDGRQVAVIAYITEADEAGALRLLGETEPGEPWEEAVAACLTALCRRPGEREALALLQRSETLPQEPQLAVFQTRLGLTVIDLAIDTARHLATATAAQLVSRVLEYRDGYAAREMLAHGQRTGLLARDQARELADVVDACGLGHREIPDALHNELSAAVARAEAVLTGPVPDLTARRVN